MKDNLMKVFGALQALPVDGEGCFGEGDERINPMQIPDEAVKAMPKIVSFGEFEPASVPGKESAAVRIGKYHDEQLAKGRKLSFAEAAEECYNQ